MWIPWISDSQHEKKTMGLTPFGIVVVVGLIVSMSELLIMLSIGSLQPLFNNRGSVFWELLDPIVLTALVSPPLYVLIFKPIQNQQFELERQNVELRRNEQLMTLIEAIPDAVFLKDGEGRWQIINESAKQMFQLHDLPWQGKTEMELADLQPSFRAAHEGCLAGDERAWEAGRLLVGEERFADEAGQYVIVETRKVPMFDKDGRRKGLMVIGRDITEHKVLEARNERLTKLYKALSEVNQAIVRDGRRVRFVSAGVPNGGGFRRFKTSLDRPGERGQWFD